MRDARHPRDRQESNLRPSVHQCSCDRKYTYLWRIFADYAKTPMVTNGTEAYMALHVHSVADLIVTALNLVLTAHIDYNGADVIVTVQI